MNDVIETALEIRNKVKTNCDLNDSDYSSFKESYPKFYTMLQNKNMNEDMFNKLIEMMYASKTLNETDAAEFSTFGAEKYLYPQFGKPTEQDMNNAKNKINKLY